MMAQPAAPAARLLRVLARGGRLVRRSGAFEVYRSEDFRGGPVGRLASPAAEDLIARGRLAEAVDGRGYCWQGPAPKAPPGRLAPPVLPQTFRRNAGAHRRRALDIALDAAAEAHAGAPLLAAANRLAADLERAAAVQSVTMRWDAAGAVDGGGAERAGTPLAASADARRRLTGVHTHVGERRWRLLADLVLHEMSLTALAASYGLRQDRALAEARAALEALAEAYDRAVRGER